MLGPHHKLEVARLGRPDRTRPLRIENSFGVNLLRCPASPSPSQSSSRGSVRSSTRRSTETAATCNTAAFSPRSSSHFPAPAEAAHQVRHRILILPHRQPRQLQPRRRSGPEPPPSKTPRKYTPRRSATPPRSALRLIRRHRLLDQLRQLADRLLPDQGVGILLGIPLSRGPMARCAARGVKRRPRVLLRRGPGPTRSIRPESPMRARRRPARFDHFFASFA